MDDKEDIYKLDEEVEDNKNNNDKEDLKSKLIKYGIIALGGFILLIFIIAFITSCSSKPKKKLNESLNLNVGDEYSLNYNDFTWESSNKNIAVVNDNKIEILESGDAVVTITTSNSIINYNIHSEDKTVSGIKLSDNTIELENGKTHELIAKLIPDNSKSNISWFSSNEEVATVTNGVVKSVSPGTCMITVKTENGYVDTCLVKVLGDGSNSPVKSIEIDSVDLSLNAGTSYPLTYKVEPSNSANLISWESSNNEVATVENGIIYPLSKGSVKITAKSGNIVKEIEVTVDDNREKILLNQTDISLYVGESYNLISSNDNSNITWSSSNSNIVEVNNGVVVAKSSGTSIITALKSDGSSATCNVNVINKQDIDQEITLNINEATVNIGESINLIETVTPLNNVSEVTWNSQDENVAKVDKGVVTGLKEGSTTITVSLPNGKKAECVVHVTQKNVKVAQVTLNANIVRVKVKGTSQLTAKILPSNATDKTIKWSSSNATIATVDNNGKVTANKAGRAIIYATSINGVYDNCEIIVTK